MSFKKLTEILSESVEAQRAAVTFAWGTVTSDDPLTITLDAERGVFTEFSGGDGLRVGDRVYVLLQAGRAVVVAMQSEYDDEGEWAITQQLDGLAEAVFEQGELVEAHEDRIKEAQGLAEKAKEDVEALGPIIGDMGESLGQLPAIKESAQQAAKDALDALQAAGNAEAVAANAVTGTVVEYALGNRETPPTSGWTTSTVTPTGDQVVWFHTVVTYGDGRTTTTAAALLTGPEGPAGSDGQPGKPGEPGVGVASTTIRYAVFTSGTTPPASGWVSNPPSASAGQYVWTETVWKYTDGTTDIAYSVGKIGDTGAAGKPGVDGKPGEPGEPGAQGATGEPGEDGVGVSATTVMYASSTSGTTVPTSGWVHDPPAAAAGRYVWTRTVWEYTDGTSRTAYSVGKIGDTGPQGTQGVQGKPGEDGEDGVGVESTVVDYAKTTSGTVTPTSGWQTSVPAATAGQYLWTRTTWKFTDGTLKVAYSVAMWGATGAQGAAGKPGEDGKPGAPGEDGVGITATTIMYASSTSGTIVPTTGWVHDPPAAAAGRYVWTRTVWEYSDGTSRIAYSVGKIGDTGSQGAPGKDGAQGPAGEQGISITGVVRYYALVNSGAAGPATPAANSTPAAGTWSATEPAYVAGKDLWTTDQITYSNGNRSYTTAAKSSSYEAAKQAMHVANLAQAAAEGLLTIGPNAPTHGPGKVWLQTNEDGSLIGVYQSVDGQWAEYTIITGVLIVPGEDGIPTVIDQNGMTIGQIWADSITGDVIAANTIGAGKLILADIGREYFREDVQDTLGDAEAWADLTLLEPGKITITSKSLTSGELSSLILRPAKIDFLVRDQPRAYIDGEKNLMWIGNAKIDDVLHVGEHQVRTLEGTNITVFQWVGGAS